MIGGTIAIVSGGNEESRSRALSSEGPDILFVGGPFPPGDPGGERGRRRFLTLTGLSDGSVPVESLGADLDGVFLQEGATEELVGRLAQVGLSAPDDAETGAPHAFLANGIALRHLATDIDPSVGDDDVAAAVVAALRLGYRGIGLLDLDRASDIDALTGSLGRITQDRVAAFSALRFYLFETGRDIQLQTLNERCPIAAAGLCSFRSASEFLGFRRLDVVVCPLTPRERDRALDNLERWSRPEAAPYLSPPSHPDVDLVFVYNCVEDSSLSRPLIEAFWRSPSLKRMFRDVQVTFLGLSGEDDVYVRTNSGPLPRYGYKAGPNLLFFGMLASLRRYRGFAFMMETDCVPIQPGWVQSLDALCRNRPHAWVIGSLYRGPGQLGDNIKRHLNGNAIYAVGDPHFWRFLDSGYLVWLKHHIETAEPDLAFDTAWERFAVQASAEMRGNAAWQIIQEVYARFVPCDEIVNIAGEAETSGRVAWSLEALRETFPYSVIAHGPVLAEARNLERTSLVDALSRLTEPYLFASAVSGLTVDSWIQEGGARIEGHFHWGLGDGARDARCGVRVRHDRGQLRAGDRLTVKITFASDRPVELRVLLQVTDLAWTRVAEETSLREPGQSRTVGLKLKLPRDVEFAQLLVEHRGIDAEPVILTIEEIELQLDPKVGRKASLRLSQADAAALGYGALSAIGPIQLRRAPRASLAPSSAPPGGSVLQAPPLPAEPGGMAALRPRYSLNAARRSGPILARSLGGTDTDRPVARLTIADGRIETVGLLADDRGPSKGRPVAIAVPKGRLSIVAYLQGGNSGAPQSISADLRAVAEELVCYWDDVETLARSHASAP